MEPKKMWTESEVRALIDEAKKVAAVEALHLAIKIHHDSFSRGTCRLALFNAILRLQGKEKELA